MTHRAPRLTSLLCARVCHLGGMPFALLITLCVALGPGLSSCSSNSKPKKNSPAAANYADMKLEQRITYQIRNRDKVQTGLAKKAYNAGKEVESGNFKTKEFAGSKMFHNKKFKTDTYAQADKKSGFLNKMFQGHDKENAMADDQFKSPLNRYGDKKPWDYDKRSKAEGDVFTTRSEPEALKKQEKNIRPLILEDSQNSGYTEFDIQKLLKKD